MPAPFAIAILAGGRARRMHGRAKGLITINGRSIVQGLIDIATERQAPVFFVGDHAAAYAHLGVPIVPDVLPDRGPPGGVLTALHQVPGWVAVLALDLPFLDGAYLDALFDDGPEAAILPVHAHRLEPLAGFWHRRALPELAQILAASRPGFASIAGRLPVRRVPWADPRPFTNLNTEADAQAAGIHGGHSRRAFTAGD